jgi:uncharacterized protein (DUF4415 family)
LASSKAEKSSSFARSAAKPVDSFLRVERGVMKEKNITVVSRGDPSRGKTDWKKVDKLTEAEIEAATANDPEWADFKDIEWSDAALVIPPKKIAISIRVDEDVLDYFKQSGVGYQRRMNAVLRSYMQQRKGKKRA